MASTTPATETDSIPLFRPSKKRKIYRQRAIDDEDATPAPSSLPPSAPAPVAQSIDELIASAADAVTSSTAADAEEGAPSIAELLRQRRKAKRAGGVEFKAAGPVIRNEDGDIVQPHDGNGHGDLVEAGGLQVATGGIRKFAPQSGTAADVNKHMMAYVESELSKRRIAEGSASTSRFTSTPTNPSTLVSNFTTASSTTSHPPSVSTQKNLADIQRQPATIGKLHEIDLGEEARLRNAEATDIARRRLHGEEIIDPATASKTAKPTKIRLGPDGKPWRSRKRRASEDIARDKLVEDILRENRLEIYEEPVASTPEREAGDDGGLAADDRIAEAFKRDFMDAISQRRRKKAAPAAQAGKNQAGKKKDEEVLRGPKLGGSRNSRQAMRDIMLKAASAKK